jgi:hypothetical protein
MKEFTVFVRYVNKSNVSTIKALIEILNNILFDTTLNLSISNSFTNNAEIVKGINVASNVNCNIFSNCKISIATTTSYNINASRYNKP